MGERPNLSRVLCSLLPLALASYYYSDFRVRTSSESFVLIN